MSLIKFKNILSCSSEDRVHCAKNLLKPEQPKNWLSSSRGTEERIICILEFEKPSFITSIDIGNDGSASIELLVSRSCNDDWIVLLPSTNLMAPDENRHQVKVFKSVDLNQICLNESWNRLKIICEQKINRGNQFGLSFIKLYSMSDEDEIVKEQTEEKYDQVQTNDQSQIMKNVIFVLSSFRNPLRSELRNKATSMGAIYNEDWDEKCTHLICAVSNTPKSTQVQQTGKGLIVNKQWIIDCYEQKQLLPEKSYQLKEILEAKKRKKKDKQKSVVPKEDKRKNPVKKKSITTNKKELDELPDFFHGNHFYVSYGDYDDYTLLGITRVILAYDGILERQINSDVKYVITNRMWNQDFEKISKSNPEINFINLDWLQDCHDANQFVAIEPYLIIR